MVTISDIIAEPFWKVHKDIAEGRHTHYWLAGGRGSAKSSFAAIELVLGVMKNPNCHAVALRKVASSLKTSVYEGVKWAITALGADHMFDYRTSPPMITYRPTGQRILFLGVDDPIKIKSLKAPFGHFGFVFYEETDQFSGMEEIRSVNQSILRGGDKYTVIYAYNPPASRDSWVNKEILLDDPDRLVSKTNYLQIPRAWLGDKFFEEAEKLKTRNELMYRHEYLGEVTGTGGAVFPNMEEWALSDSEIREFGYRHYGIDFGFSVDPFCFIACHYDPKREILYLYDEIYGTGVSNKKAYQAIAGRTREGEVIYADSAEPKSIAELRGYGLDVHPVKKGPDSVDYGISWLQHLEAIRIDKKRCPNAYVEFASYEYRRNRDGDFVSEYPDRNNHAIDAVRYACHSAMRKPIDITSRRSGL